MGAEHSVKVDGKVGKVSAHDYLDLTAWGHGLATITTPAPDSGVEPVILDVWYPRPMLGDPGQTHPPVGFEAPSIITEAVRQDPVRGVETFVVFTASDLSKPPVDVADAYLRLHLLSHRLVKPNSVNLDGMMEILPEVVWTDIGPCLSSDFEQVQFRARTSGENPITVNSVGQIPRMVDYVVPTDIRISDPNKVKLGAHLAPGTTVAHSGSVDHNAGTDGRTRVENHIVAGHFMPAHHGDQETRGRAAPNVANTDHLAY